MSVSSFHNQKSPAFYLLVFQVLVLIVFMGLRLWLYAIGNEKEEKLRKKKCLNRKKKWNYAYCKLLSPTSGHPAFCRTPAWPLSAFSSSSEWAWESWQVMLCLAPPACIQLLNQLKKYFMQFHVSIFCHCCRGDATDQWQEQDKSTGNKLSVSMWFVQW